MKTKLGHLVIARGAQEAKSIAEGKGYIPEKLNDCVIYGTPDRVKESVGELAAAGAEYLILNIHPEREQEMLRLFAEEVASSFS